MRLSSGSANYVPVNTSSTLVTGKGVVWTLVATCNHATNIGYVILYDNTSATGTILMAFDVSNQSPLVIHWPRVGLAFATGLTVKTSAEVHAHLVVES